MSKKRNKTKEQQRIKAQQTAQAEAAKKSSSFTKVSLVVLVVAMIISAVLFLNTSRHATDEELSALKSDETVQAHSINNNAICLEAQNAKAGVIFYPGERIQVESYAPLMHELASRGITCVLEPMPFNIASFRKSAADDVQEALPNIKNWYMAGHSLGGSVATDYANKHADAYNGIILLSPNKQVNSTLPILDIDYDLEDQTTQNATVVKQIEAFISETATSK